jgi:cell pole-organizing protein PopZ
MLRTIAGIETQSGPAVVSNLRHPDLAPQSFQPAQPQQKALSLADVAARVRAASERTSMVMRELATTSQPEQPEQPAPVVSQPTALAPAVVAEEAQVREPVEQVRQPMEEAPREFVADTRVLPVESALDEEPSYRAEPISILSSSTGEQVARSFQDLALALDDAQRRSLDQIAEDMLRPMLQEWLDDNLPTLVERLVREEIERVARGPRR